MKKEYHCVPPIVCVYISITQVQICSYLFSCISVFLSVGVCPYAPSKPQVWELSLLAYMCCCVFVPQHSADAATRALLSLQEVTCVTSHQPGCIWDKWGIDTYWLGKLPQETVPFTEPALPQCPGIEKQMALLTQQYSAHGTCLVAQTQPLHRTQLCPTASPTDWQI